MDCEAGPLADLESAASHRRLLGPGRRLVAVLGLVGYAVAFFLVAQRWELPSLGLGAALLLALALVAEFGAKGILALLFRGALERQGHVVTRRASFTAALVGTATARLLPGGSTLAPSTMAWAVRAEDDEAAGAALRAAMIGYGGLLLLTGFSLGWAASAGSDPQFSTGAAATGVVMLLAGSFVLVGTRWLGRLVATLPRWLRHHFGPTAAGGHITAKEVGLVACRLAMEVGALWLVLRAFQINLSPSEVVVTFGTATVISGLPVSPGGIGLVEGGLVSVLAGFGFPTSQVVAPILFYRIINYWIASGIGLLAASRVARSHLSA